MDELHEDRDILRMTNENLVEANESVQFKLVTSTNRVNELVGELDNLLEKNRMLANANERLLQDKKLLVATRIQQVTTLASHQRSAGCMQMFPKEQLLEFRNKLSMLKRCSNDTLVPFPGTDLVVQPGEWDIDHIRFSLGSTSMSIPFTTFLAMFVQCLWRYEKMPQSNRRTAGEDVLVDHGYKGVPSLEKVYVPVTACISIVSHFLM
jgi:hypothetical protein